MIRRTIVIDNHFDVEEHVCDQVRKKMEDILLNEISEHNIKQIIITIEVES